MPVEARMPAPAAFQTADAAKRLKNRYFFDEWPVHEKFTEIAEFEFDKPGIYGMITVLKPTTTGK